MGISESTGSGNTVIGTFTNRAFSCVMDYGILISSGQINVFSDIRLKSNINDLDPDETMRFINTIKPISFQYKESHTEDKSIYYGYSAQSLVSNLFPNLVGYTEIQNQESNNLENLELQDNLDIECIDGSTIHLEKNQKLVVDLQKMIPILHKAIQLSNQNQKRMELLLSNCENRILKLELSNNLIVNQLNFLMQNHTSSTN